MKKLGLLKSAYLTLLSRPKCDRQIYRIIRKQRIASIVEIGIKRGIRAQRMIEVAMSHHEAGKVRYAGIDLFEARPPSGAGLKLKEAHRMMSESSVSIKLIPGDPYSALARAANALTGTDLIVVSADQDQESLARAWFYVPRMLHEGSRVFLESLKPDSDEPSFSELSAARIQQLAIEASPAKRRAA